MTEPSPAAVARPRRLSLPLVFSTLALAGTALLWLSHQEERSLEAERQEQLGTLERRLAMLEERIQRERDAMARLEQKIGTDVTAGDTLTGRINRIEETIARLPGAGEGLRFAWLLAQAEYYLRIANAQETLAGDPIGALTALEIADGHLRDAADPRLTGVRKLLAQEIAALRKVPKVDVEGLVLKLGALADGLGALPRRQVAPTSFAGHPAPVDAQLRGWDRAVQAVRNALLAIVSVRRSETAPSPLLSEEAVTLLTRSLELELQMARLALLRGQTTLLRGSLQRVKTGLESYFDTSTPAGADALALINELAAAPLPDALPDISASLTELLRVRERTGTP